MGAVSVTENCNRSSRIRFVLFLTRGDGSIALKDSMIYLVRNYTRNNLQASYSAGSCFYGLVCRSRWGKSLKKACLIVKATNSRVGRRLVAMNMLSCALRQLIFLLILVSSFHGY